MEKIDHKKDHLFKYLQLDNRYEKNKDLQVFCQANPSHYLKPPPGVRFKSESFSRSGGQYRSSTECSNYDLNNTETPYSLTQILKSAIATKFQRTTATPALESNL